MNNNPLEIMPEQFYLDTLRPHMIIMLGQVKYDDVLTLTLEETINKADGFAGNKQYKDLASSFDVLTGVLLDPRSQYFKNLKFIRADDKDKEMVRKLAKHIQDILTIIQYSKAEAKIDLSKPRKRLNYSDTAKENVMPNVPEQPVETKPRIPNM